MSKTKRGEGLELLKVLGVLIILGVFLFGFISAADPVRPDEIESIANETKSTSGTLMFNVSGGYVSTFNLTATIQDDRWKAFVGNVTGSFTLDDSTGSTIYDWTLSSITGRVYATRNSSTVTWSSIECSNNSLLEQENTWLSHTNHDDNLTATFNTNLSDVDHDPFYVGGQYISADTCPTLSTYVNNQSQAQGADVFEEMALIDNQNITVYATILEEDAVGFDGNRYDFQMLVPENGSAAWEGALPYYVYIELG